MEHSNSIKFYEFSFGIALFSQVIFPHRAPFGILIFALAIIYLLIKKEMCFHFTKTHLFFALFYLVFLVGTFFTNFPQETHHILESKVSFLIFPILFLAIPKKKVNELIPALFFFAALFIYSILGIIHSFSCYQSTGFTKCFTSVDFSYIHHPTYVSIYFLVGIFWLIRLYRRKRLPFPKIGFFLLLIDFLVAYFLCMALSAILFLFLLFVGIGIIYFKRKFGWKKSVISMLTVVLFLIGIGAAVKDIGKDVARTSKAVVSYVQSPHQYLLNARTNYHLSGNEVRLILWTVAGKAVAEKPLGYGTGSVDTVMHQGLINYDIRQVAEKGYNTHNQYLQTFMELGVIGFLLLFALFYFPFVQAYTERNWLALLLIAAFAFNSLFESMFQRESGIVFYVMMIFFFLSIENFSTKKEEQ